MDVFVPKIKQKYIERLINREKQWPPCHINKLIRLQLIERRKGEGYRATVQRGTEDKLAIKQSPLAYSGLFRVERGNKPIRKILVEGDAGIGKTTLSTSLSEDWAHEKLFQEFELLLLLPLRHKKVASVDSITDLLKLLHPSSDVCNAVAKYVESKEEKILIIADGWDELSESDQQEGSFLYELLFETFPLMSVIVTSRPSASAPLHRLPCIDRFVEINGFSKDDIKEYIEFEFTSDQEKASCLLEQLDDNPLVESVCSIPLNSAIICHLWRTLEEDLPSTMTQLYTKIILNVILRNIQKKEAFKNVSSLLDFNHLPKDLQPSFRLLCKFAFQSLKKNQIVFSQEELAKYFPEGLTPVLSFGLLQSAETVLETGHGVSFHFIHLTFMEYLAALHLVELPKCSQLEEFCQNVSYPYGNFEMLWSFFFGITCHHSNFVMEVGGIIDDIFKYVKSACLYHEACLSLCHCAFEAQNDLIASEVAKLTSKYMNVYNADTAHDCSAILYVLAHMEKCNHTIMMIDFSDSGVRDRQIKTLTDLFVSKQGKLYVNALNLNGNKLIGMRVSGILHTASTGCLFDTKPKSKRGALAKSIPSRHGLPDSCNSPGIYGMQVLVNAIHSDLFSRLEHLSISGCLASNADTNDKWLIALTDALSTHCPCIRELDLSRNNLGVVGASALARGLTELQRNSSRGDGFWLSMNETSLGDDGLQAFIDNIEGVCNFDHLYLSGNNINSVGVSYLADSGKIVLLNMRSELNLSDNPLGLEGGLAVCRMLRRNHTSYVDLSRCKLTTSKSSIPNTGSLNIHSNSVTSKSGSVLDAAQYSCQKPHNCTIEWLVLNGNNFAGDGIHILMELISLSSRLLLLSCRDCGIASADLTWLLNKLTQLKSLSPTLCLKLHTWYLDNNAIDNSGVTTLISHMPSLFPGLEGDLLNGITVDNNQISIEMEMSLREGVRRVKYSNTQEALKRLEETRKKDSRGQEMYCPIIQHNSSSKKCCLIENDMTTSQEVSSHASCNQNEEQRSCDPSHDSSDDDIFYTPPSSPLLLKKDYALTVSVKKEIVPSLTENDLASVLRAVWEGRSKWYNLGLELGLTAGTLDAIRQTNYNDSDSCFTTTLKTWLRSANLHPSRSSLAKALRAPPVGLGQLAEQLKNLDRSIFT